MEIRDLTEEQATTIIRLCRGYNVSVDDTIRDMFHPFDLPDGYVAGWIGGNHRNGEDKIKTIYVGIDPHGEASS